MRAVILLSALLMYGSAPAYAHKGMQRIASTVKSKVWQLGATGAVASLLLFTAPTGVEAGLVAEVTQQGETETKSEIDWDKFERDLPDIVAQAVAETDAILGHILGHREELFLTKMQQLIDDMRSTDDTRAKKLMLAQSLFIDAGLLDSLPASVRKLQISKNKQGLQLLITRIDEIALPLGEADDLIAYFYNSGELVERMNVVTHVRLLGQSKSYRRVVKALEKEAAMMAFLYNSGKRNEWVMWYSRALGVSAKGLSNNPSDVDKALQYLRVQFDEVVTLAQEVDNGEVDKELELASELGILRERAAQTLSVIESGKAKQHRRMWRTGR